MELPYIVALDPGGTTGWCAWCPREPEELQGGHLDTPEHHKELFNMLYDHMQEASVHQLPLHVVCEKFEFRKDDQNRDKIDYISREYIGVVKLWMAHMTGRTPFRHQRVPVAVFQSSSLVTGKAFWGDDDKIKQLGLWRPGLRHCMDAVRHYLYYRTFTLGDQALLQGLR